MKLPGYNYRTGDPSYDNVSRRMNVALRRQMKFFHVDTPGGRRRKKQITKIEGARYLSLINQVILDKQRIGEWR